MRLDRKIDDHNRRIVAEVETCATTLIRLYGFGPINAALILGEVGDVSRSPNRDHFASSAGISPIDHPTHRGRTADRNGSNPSPPNIAGGFGVGLHRSISTG